MPSHLPLLALNQQHYLYLGFCLVKDLPAGRYGSEVFVTLLSGKLRGPRRSFKVVEVAFALQVRAPKCAQGP